MRLNIALCDDRAEDIALLSDALLAYDPSFEITVYTSGKALTDDFPHREPCADILFLDIYMPGIDGIQTARMIRDHNPDVKIIFLSSSREHYPQAYELFAFNYIVKPFDRVQLYRVLDRAIDEIGKDRSRKIRISYKSVAYSVDLRDILYLESRNKLILFHLADGRSLQRYGKLDELMEELPEQAFLRCHQSFIVNMDRITEMGEGSFRLGQVMISISKKYVKPAKERYYAYLFAQMGRGLSQ